MTSKRPVAKIIMMMKYHLISRLFICTVNYTGLIPSTRRMYEHGTKGSYLGKIAQQHNITSHESLLIDCED